MNRLDTLRICGALVLGLALVDMPAQAQNKPLRGAQITEGALIDALTIEPAADGASAATRGFRPGVRAGMKNPGGAGKANLLIVFRTDSAELAPESRAALDTLAKAMQSDALASFSFRVEGHADARGEAERNLKLSQLRAETVARYLATSHGIKAERLVAEGKGTSEPLNKERVDAPENRRVTIVTQRN